MGGISAARRKTKPGKANSSRAAERLNADDPVAERKTGGS
jgi:hypothetical protein